VPQRKIGSVYSLRKRKLIRRGHPATLLRWNEGLAWLRSLLVLVHAGVHDNACASRVSLTRIWKIACTGTA